MLSCECHKSMALPSCAWVDPLETLLPDPGRHMRSDTHSRVTVTHEHNSKPCAM